MEDRDMNTYRCDIKVIDNGMYNTSFLQITSPTGNSVSLPMGLQTERIPDALWKTYAKLIYRKSWMTYIMLTIEDMKNILEIQRRKIAIR